MPVAKYTQQLIDQLADTGVCLIELTDSLSESVARSRISNAAKRAGLLVRAAKVYTNGPTYIVGEVQATADLTPTESLRRMGYQIRPVPFTPGVRVAWIKSDRTKPYEVHILGDWPSAEAATEELARCGWPTTQTMLNLTRELHNENP
jgi:hypothetical protein